MTDFLSLSSEISDYDSFFTDDSLLPEDYSQALSLKYPEPIFISYPDREPLSFTVDFPDPLFGPSSSSITNNNISSLSNFYQDYHTIKNISDQLSDFNTSSLLFHNSFYDNSFFSSLSHISPSYAFSETFNSLSSLYDKISNDYSFISSFSNIRNSPLYSFFDSSSLSSFSSSLNTLFSFPQTSASTPFSLSFIPPSYNITNDLPILSNTALPHSENAISTQNIYNAFQTNLSTPYQRLEDNQQALITIAKQIKDLLMKINAPSSAPIHIQIAGD